MNSKNPKELNSHEDVLEAIAEAIDIPEHMEQIARDRYQSLGAWLDRAESTIKKFDPDISPQGSFLLGTVIRPVGDADEFDIDLVCKLKGTKFEFSMASLKETVGAEIKSYAQAHGLENEPEDGRRCWTLEYSDDVSFHMDILPALPDETAYRILMEDGQHLELAANQDIREQALAITDKTDPKYQIIFDDWPVTNPKGFALWFQSRQAKIVFERKSALVETELVFASVDDVPDYKVKTPLQRAIQLLKRHRDTMFVGDDEKPISIIITTLSAQAYNGEETISGALRSILKNVHLFIGEGADDEKLVLNPVNPNENFADKWTENPAKKRKFFEWLEKARNDFGLYLTANAYSQIPVGLQSALSEGTIKKIFPLIALSAPAIITSVAVAAETEKIVSAGGATKPWRE